MRFDVARVCASRVRHLAVLMVISLLLLTMNSACGKKGPVRPKLDAPILPPQEVTLLQQGNLFVLGWEIPSKDKDGREGQELTGFRIKRLTYDATEGCPTCRDPQTIVAELDIMYPDPGQRIGKRIYWRDLDIRRDSGYRYAIVPLIFGGQEGPAVMAHQVALQPPPGPTNLQVTAGDARVTVQWAAPDLPAEMQLLGYNLYRRQAELPFPIIPLNSKPLQETRLLDRGLDNGRSYEYRVSALVRLGDQQVESMASPGARGTPQEGL